ncbi:N-formylglutamate amidohydrolase [Phyllobacterium sp. 0TCS1.6C]|uniref:N-formylglutamate amidohydrolase n=1 Tax=unclassified Phyllobacterium TaxID=2638441 RepID=UPI0022649115|nr:MULTISPECIES: N-formylglutamate amidohydrolase [unclassified Phyllobacterium]MCX8280893.1 N-formylglutamate amidohydrolase [Phyllobacterium sp. 0TCS1.6C]MCX8295759.1 N-formylglutamate amidohydrolase [Phyllobacterium sp. 0TCS1.6A]
MGKAVSKEAWTADKLPESPVRVSNAAGRGRAIILCDHASNHIPAKFGTLGLSPIDLTRHIAWDPGALGVSNMLARLLDAPLVESCISRLIVDCNRPPNAPDLIPSISELTVVPANQQLDEAAIKERIALSHRPYHAAIEDLIGEREREGFPAPVLVAVHSYTPVYRGVSRPWHIGIIHDADTSIAAPLIEGLEQIEGLVVGDNEPYSPADRVYYTLERHASARRLSAVMIEIRNDLITTPHEEQVWAERLALLLKPIIKKPLRGVRETPDRES